MSSQETFSAEIRKFTFRHFWGQYNVGYDFVLFLGFGDGANRHLSASQLHLLLHPTDEGEDETLGNSQQIVST